MQKKKFRFFVVDSDSASRMKLKSVASAYLQIEELRQTTRAREAIDILKGEKPFDVIFLSSRLDSSEMSRLIVQTATIPACKHTAIVLFLKVEHQDSSFIARNIIEGVDGFIFEPISVDALLEVVQAAINKAKDGRAQLTSEQKLIMLKFLAADASHHLDRVAYKLAIGSSPGYALRDFRDACGMLTKLQAELPNYFEDTLVEHFSAVPTPNPIKNRKSRYRAKEGKTTSGSKTEQSTGYFIRKR